ncbi:MAG: hypothetical protein V4553_14450 [Bacteroidota bacterium]
MKNYIIKMLTLLVFASVVLAGCSLQYQQRRHQYDRDGSRRDNSYRYPQNRYQNDQRGQTQNGNYHDSRSNFHN